MRIPQYWAEGRAHRPRIGRESRQVTVRRWGWSDESQEDAQRHADERAQEGLARVLAGENRPRREPKVPYNGAEGVPIREEIVARHGETIITRNSYGALCLNTPNVLFADVDFPVYQSGVPGCLGVLAGAASASALAYRLDLWRNPTALLPLVFIGVVLGYLAFSGGAELLARACKTREKKRDEAERATRERIDVFLYKNQRWSLVLYRTPAGMRVVARHALFEAEDEETTEFFEALQADPIYVVMCQKQDCFRARVSPKPWRIGIEDRLTPRPGVWPISPERMPGRIAWVERYEEAAKGYASCRYLETLGSETAHPSVMEVLRLHDELCRADSDLPIA